MPITSAERSVLGERFDEVLMNSSLDTAFATARRMVRLGVIEEDETKPFMVGFPSGA